MLYRLSYFRNFVQLFSSITASDFSSSAFLVLKENKTQKFKKLHLKVLFSSFIFHIKLLRKISFSKLKPEIGRAFGGRRWIRTTEGINQQIYSLPHLATLVFSHFLFLLHESFVVLRIVGLAQNKLKNLPFF